MPLTKEQTAELERMRSTYGCGSPGCVSCYPVQYGCEYCGTDFDDPIAHGEVHTCAYCEWENNA